MSQDGGRYLLLVARRQEVCRCVILLLLRWRYKLFSSLRHYSTVTLFWFASSLSQPESRCAGLVLPQQQSFDTLFLIPTRSVAAVIRHGRCVFRPNEEAHRGKNNNDRSQALPDLVRQPP